MTGRSDTRAGAIFRRRGFLGLALPLIVHGPGLAAGQGRERVRTVGLLVSLPPDDQSPRLPAMKGDLERLGWIEGRNIRYEIRSTYGPRGTRQSVATEMVNLKPDVILASSSPETAALLALTRTIPII